MERRIDFSSWRDMARVGRAMKMEESSSVSHSRGGDDLEEVAMTRKEGWVCERAPEAFCESNEG